MKSRRLISLLCAIAMSLTLVLPVSAVGTEEVTPIFLDPIVVYAESKTQEEIDQEIQQRLAVQISNAQGSSSQRVREYYKSVWGTAQRKVVGDFAGNQPNGGNQFPTGGGFYFADQGGPEASVSVGFSDPFGIVNVSVNLGIVSDTVTGKFVIVPDKVNYYKLYVEKTVDVKPCAVYEVPSQNASVEEGRLSYITSSVVVYSVRQWAEKV